MDAGSTYKLGLMAIILGLERQRQEDFYKFKESLGYITEPGYNYNSK